MVLIKTLLVGMILRSAVQHDGTPVSFVVVAIVFLTVTLVGWRVAAYLLAMRQRPVRTAGRHLEPERVS